MASIFRRKTYKPVPAGATITERRGQRVASWTDTRGKKRKAAVRESNGESSIIVQSKIWTAKYRTHDGRVLERSTGCRDEQSARAVLADWLGEQENLRAGIYSEKQLQTAEHLRKPIQEHIDAYLSNLDARSPNPEHRANVVRQLERIINDCGWRVLADIDATELTKWMVDQANEMSGRTRNMYRGTWIAFCNWLKHPSVGRLPTNPLDGVPKADESQAARQRRALDQDDLVRFLDAARRRPLIDAMTVRRGPNRGKPLAKLRESTRARLVRLGVERDADLPDFDS